MPRYQFTVTLEGEGDGENEAWADAIEAFTAEPGEPETTTELDD